MADNIHTPNIMEDCKDNLEENLIKVKQADRDKVKLNRVRVSMESSKKEATKQDLYFSDETKDFMYQYKFFKIKGLDITNIKLKSVSIKEGMSFHLEDTKLINMFDGILGAISKIDIEKLVSSKTQKYSFEDENKKTDTKTETLTLFQKLTRMKREEVQLFPDEVSELRIETDMFFPNFNTLLGSDLEKHKMLEKSLHSKHEIEPLKEWLDNPYGQGRKFAFYRYAKAMLEIKDADSSRTAAKNPHLVAGYQNSEVESVCLYLQYIFRQIRISSKYSQRNMAKFDEAYDKISDVILTCGLVQHRSLQDSDMPILKLFYTLLDCYPDFRSNCYRRVRNACSFVSGMGPGRDMFDAEIHMLKDKSMLNDLVMIMLMEFDISSDMFLYSLNLLEYLCSSNPEFSYLGLFLGDFYDQSLLGAIKMADDDKRLSFYETVYQSDLQQKDLLKMNSRVRLSVAYQFKFEQLMKEHTIALSSADPSRVPKEEELKKIFTRLMTINTELIEISHPIGLIFFANYYIRCDQYKMEKQDDLKSKSGINPQIMILQKRNQSLTHAARYLQILFILGDRSHNYLYYRILRHLKLVDIIQPAMRIVGDASNENAYMPLAYCKEKGIGCVADKDFAGKTYKRAISSFIEQGDIYRVGLVMYRIGLIFLKGGKSSTGKKYIISSLVYVMHSNFEGNVDKKFLLQIVTSIKRLAIPEWLDLCTELLELAYAVYPVTPIEYILHHGIEDKMNQDNSVYLKSLKKSKAETPHKIFIAETFTKECMYRKDNMKTLAKINKCLKKLRELAVEYMRTEYPDRAEMVGMDKVGELEEMVLLKTLEELDKNGEFSKDLNLNELRMEESVISTQRSCINDINKQRFDQIKIDIEKVFNEKLQERSIQKKTDDRIKSLADNNKAITIIDPNEIEEFSNPASPHEFDCKFEPYFRFTDMKFKQTGQLCKRLTLSFDKASAVKSFIDNFDCFLTYNPLLLNYLGLSYVKSKILKTELSENQAQSSEWKINLYTEYFRQTANNFTSNGILTGSVLPLDKTFKIAYQLIHAIRSLHVIGRVSYFIEPSHIAITDDYDVHLIVPFFDNYFNDPKIFIDRCGKDVQRYSYLAPENFVDDETIAKMKHQIKFFSILGSARERLFFEYSSATDIWSLGIFLVQLFTDKAFYISSNFVNHDQFLKFMRHPSKLKSHVKNKLDSLPKELDKRIQNMLYMMLRTNPLRRPSIEHVLEAFEAAVFNGLFDLKPINFRFLNQQMFENAYFDKTKEVKIESDTLAEKMIIRLPKGYVYEGKTKRGIPYGQGEIKQQRKLVLSGNFKDGILEGKADFTVGGKDAIIIETVKGGNPENKGYSTDLNLDMDDYLSRGKDKKRPVSYNSKPTVIPSGSIVYDRSKAYGQAIQVGTFEKNSWLPNKEDILEKFKKFEHADHKENVKADRFKPAPKKEEELGTMGTFNQWNLDKNRAELKNPPQDESKMKDNIDIFRVELVSKSKYKMISTEEREQLKTLIGHWNELYGIHDNDNHIDDDGKRHARRHKHTGELSQYLDLITESVKCYDQIGKYDPLRAAYLEQMAKDIKEEQEASKSKSEKKNEKKVEKNMRKSQAKDGYSPMIKNEDFMHNFSKSIESKGLDLIRTSKPDQAYTMIIDMFGNCTRFKYDNTTMKICYDQDFVITQLETYKQYQLVAFSLKISNKKLFLSRIITFALCDTPIPIKSFRDLNSAFNESRFEYAIITEMKDKQYRGKIGEDGPTIGTLYMEKGEHIKYQRGSGTNYKGFIVDNENKTKYEGDIVGTNKHGYGRLYYEEKLAYCGYFREGVPHGKGLYINQNSNLAFKGIFKNGQKRFGTSIYYSEDREQGNKGEQFKIEINGIYHLMPKDKPKEESIRTTALKRFLNMMRDDKLEYAVEGSYREKGEYPIYFTTFKGINKNFNGTVKVYYNLGAYFLGTYENGARTGEGVMIDEKKGTMHGEWNGDKLKGYYKLSTKDSNKSSKQAIRTGNFQVEYPGDFKQHGIGSIQLADNTIYRGEISNNLPHGFGYKKNADGSEYRGQFEYGNYNGIGILVDNIENCSYEGNFIQDKLNGYGIFRKEQDSFEGFWNDHQMELLFSEKSIKTLNGKIIASIASKVEFNTFENSYTKKGVCQMSFLKLIRENNNPIQKIISEIITLLLQVVMLTKFKQKDTFKIAYFILEHFSSKMINHIFNEQEELHNFKLMAETAVKHIFKQASELNIQSEADFSRDTEKSILHKYKANKSLIDAVVFLVITRLTNELSNTESELMNFVKSILLSPLQDHRQKDTHDSIKAEFRKKLYGFVSPAVAELGRLLIIKKEEEQLKGQQKYNKVEDEKYSNQNESRLDSSQIYTGRTEVITRRKETNLDASKQEEAGSIKEISAKISKTNNSTKLHRPNVSPVGLNLSPMKSQADVLANIRSQKGNIQRSIKQIQIGHLSVRSPEKKPQTQSVQTLPRIDLRSGLQTQTSKDISIHESQLGSNHGTSRTAEMDEIEEDWEELWPKWYDVVAAMQAVIEQVDDSIPDEYVGEIFNDEINGVGSIVHRKVEVYRGEFKENEACGLGELLIFNSARPGPEEQPKVFRGIIENMKPNGYGSLKERNSEWHSRFEDGKRTGLAICRTLKNILAIGWYEKGIKNEYTLTVKKRCKPGLLIYFKNGVEQHVDIIPDRSIVWQNLIRLN